ncbi:MAG: homoserine/homoserine lactone efflux protein [Candidatus Accumulibacter sp.]|nr:homoserine/homoserine lactone efflux protein [Accumulibacter sp.]
MELTTWLAFLLAAVLIAVSPGPGAATTMSVGLRHGYRAALRAIGGLQCALLIQLSVVAAGLGALLSASTLAFNVMKFLGAGYLIWLGVQKWRAAPQAIDGEDAVVKPQGLFRQGLLVNLTNPKAIVFIAALTPQFIDPSRPQWLQFAIIGATMCGVDIIVMSGYAVLAARLRRHLRAPRVMRAQSRFFGGIFIGAGVLLAASGRN